MRLIVKLESSSAFIAMAQEEALPLLLDIVKEVSSAMDQAHRAKEDDKQWLSLKHERQLLELSVASVKVIVSLSTN